VTDGRIVGFARSTLARTASPGESLRGEVRLKADHCESYGAVAWSASD
jgi:hypothetical protein